VTALPQKYAPGEPFQIREREGIAMPLRGSDPIRHSFLRTIGIANAKRGLCEIGRPSRDVNYSVGLLPALNASLHLGDAVRVSIETGSRSAVKNLMRSGPKNETLLRAKLYLLPHESGTAQAR
jgi:hypothetical protein